MSDDQSNVTGDCGERKARAGLVRSLTALLIGGVAYFMLVSYSLPPNTRYSFGMFAFTAGQVQTFALVVIGLWTVVVAGWVVVFFDKRTGFSERYYDR